MISSLFWVTLLGTLGWTLATTDQSSQCTSEQNTNVLERAFGLVMKTKLEAQSLAIQTKMDFQTSELKEDSEEQTMKIQEKIDSQTSEIKDHVDSQMRGIQDHMDFQVELSSQTSEIKDHVDSQIRGIQDHLDFQGELSAQTSEIKATLEMQASQITRVEENQEKMKNQIIEVQANLEKLETRTSMILQQMQTFFEDRFGWSMEKSELERAVKENLLNFDMTEPEWVEDSLIWFSNQAANFDQAQANCQSMGGHLFEPQTLHENNQVYELMEAKGRTLNWHWIGINDKAQEGT